MPGRGAHPWRAIKTPPEIPPAAGSWAEKKHFWAVLFGKPAGPRGRLRRARRRAQGREARTELKQIIIRSRGWIAPLRTDCDKARGGGHRTGCAAGFLRSQQPCSSGLAVFFFSLSFLERAAAAAANFRPFPRPFFFFFPRTTPKPPVWVDSLESDTPLRPLLPMLI